MWGNPTNMTWTYLIINKTGIMTTPMESYEPYIWGGLPRFDTSDTVSDQNYIDNYKNSTLEGILKYYRDDFN